MKNISINLPDLYLEMLDDLGKKLELSRSELLRRAIKYQIEKDLKFLESIDPEIKIKVKTRIKTKNLLRLYKKCINCGRDINVKEPYTHDHDFEVMEFRFCCSCFKKYETLAFDDFPKDIKDKIRKRLEESYDILMKIKEIEQAEKKKHER